MLRFLKGQVGSGAGIKDSPYSIGEPYSSAWGFWTHSRGTAKLSTVLGQRITVPKEDCCRLEGDPWKKQIEAQDPVSKSCISPVLGNHTNYCSQIPTFCLEAVYGAKLLTLDWKSRHCLPYAVRGLSTQTALLARQRSANETDSEGGLARQEDPFDTITDKIPEKPVTVAEGASYSVVILIGLAIAGAAAYAVFKELIFEPREYKVFGKALNRVQHDNQVSARLGSPITGYGQESRNRAARQRISNRTWTDEAGVERVEVMFHIRGPGGAGKVYSEMFRDPEDKSWKYTYLVVDISSPYPTRLMLESYVPPLAPLNAL